MADLDLCVPVEHISDFLGQASRAMDSRRAKTVFGKEESTHWIHSALSTEQSSAAPLPIIVVLKVRSQSTKKGGRDVRVFLTAVRPPEGDELTEGGYPAPTPWPDDFAKHAWETVVQTLREAATAVMTPPSASEFRRG